MTERKKILFCTPYYTPAFITRNSIRSIEGLIRYLGDDFEFYVLTSAFDKDGTQVSEEMNTWIPETKFSVKFLSKDHLSKFVIRENILQVNPDIIYVNNAFSRLFALTPLNIAKKNNIQVIIASNGVIDKNSIEAKQVQSRLIFGFSKKRRLFEKVKWHVSSSAEAEDVKDMFGEKSNIITTSPLPATPVLSVDELHGLNKKEEIRLIYIGNISKETNCKQAIEAVLDLKTDKRVVFSIYGYIEDKSYYLQEIFPLEKRQGANKVIEIKENLSPKDYKDTFNKYHYMFSLNKPENEFQLNMSAIANGTPAIIRLSSNNLDLEYLQIGWNTDLDADKIQQTLSKAVNQSQEEFEKWQRNCLFFYQERLASQVSINQNKQLFEEED